MKNESEQQSEVQKASNAGLKEIFRLAEGKIRRISHSEQVYAFCHVVTGIYPCSINKQNVYHITTPDGVSGIAIKDW